MSEQPEGPQDRPGARSGSLADAMRSQVEEEVRGVTEAAGKEAVDIVRSARRVARLRLHKAVQAMRSERRNAIQRATAQLHAAERRQRYNTEMAVLGEAMTALRQAVGERWRKADDRRQWCLSLVDAAKDRLEPGTWTIEHPQDWEPERDNALVAALKGQLGALPAFKPDETIDAGIRIRGDHSCLDGTLDGLLVRRNWVEAALLAQLGEKMPGEMSAGAS